MKIGFFEIEDWEIDYLKKMFNKLGIVAELFFFAEKLNKDLLPGQRDFDIISVFVGSNITKEVIEYFPDLKLITTRSTGFDHIDLATAKEKNIAVGYVPGYGDNTVAEFAFGLLLTLSRKIYEAYDRIREIGSFSLDGLRGFDLKGKTIGIIGTGRIGKCMIKIARGFDMNVVAFDVQPDEEFAKENNFQYLTLDDLLTQSDVISLHVPYIPPSDSNQGTYHLINSENISKIKKGAILINTSRGPIVETEVIVKALNDGILSGVGLDTFEEEGASKDEKTLLLYGRPEEHDLKKLLANRVLIDMPNAIITPHNAFNTNEALQRILDIDIENIKSFVDKKTLVYPIRY
ncbi:hydroxyacid dehydrogenase [Candidatus Wolfebacteria bacterium]|nr:hydroxyacid dehydrogenase [Candidatus Wolfebacteria bacterium]